MREIEHFLTRELWTIDLRSVSRLKRWGVRALRLALAVSWEFRQRLLDARAAGLVYTTLLSLVPFLAVIVSVLKAFGVHKRVEPILSHALEPLGANGEEVTARVIQFVNNMDVGVLGVVGIAGLLYTTYSLIEKVEDTFNAIWRVRRGRSWKRKFTDYLSVVLVGPVLVVSAFGLLASIQSHALVQRVIDIQPFGYLFVWGAQYVPFLLLLGVFTFFYKFIPHTEVRARSALVGGVAAAFLWGVAGEAFAAFVVGSTKYSAIYSGFAVLILFLLWLYVSWLIILVGAQVAYFHQHPGAYEPQYRWTHGTHALRERAALQMFHCVSQRYLSGEPPYQLEELATESGLPVPIVDELTELFVAAGYLAHFRETKAIGFVRPPGLITVEALLKVVGQGGADASGLDDGCGGVVDVLLRRRDAAVAHVLDGMTLETLSREAQVQDASKPDQSEGGTSVAE